MKHGHPADWHSLETGQVLDRMKARVDTGLDSAAVSERLARFGENRLPEPRGQGVLVRFLRQFQNILIHVLMVAALVTALLGHWLDTAVIMGVVAINAIIGFIQEGRAEQAMNSIRRMLTVQARVLRDGEVRPINATGIVPGDIVLLESGDRVSADLRLIRQRGLRVDESGLTGESVPVDKQTDAMASETVLADRTCMAWSGTLVTSGQARGIAVATGTDTELGRISRAVEQAPRLRTPLLEKIHRFGGQLTVAILGLSVFSFLVGILWHQQPAGEMFLAAVGLAVAAIPEGLPAIITITLALGVQAMASRQTIVRRLPAVETLGAVTVICTDKTGTLTRNEMTVRSIRTGSGLHTVSGAGYAAEGGIESPPASSSDKALTELLLASVLCNEAELRHEEGGDLVSGDPMEAALLVVAEKAEYDLRRTRGGWPRTDAIPFESERRYMATLNHDHHGEGRILVKGAPELLLDICRTYIDADGRSQTIDRAAWEKVLDEFAAAGQRTLALGMKSAPADQDALDESDITSGLELLGVLALEDPPRPEAIEAVTACRNAGIRVKMITGDHLGTALAIGKQLGIGNGLDGMSGEQFQALEAEAVRDVAGCIDVFARFSPDNKLTLLEALRRHGEVTAMTGDGVNDAPALRNADVGIAMGGKGTEAAKEAAEMVITDDNFATIANAVRTGRGIYDNIQKSILFILPTNGGEALLILAAVILGIALPVTPVQILWINMVTAVTLALALSFEPTETGVMKRPPRPPNEPVLTGYIVWRILYVSLLILAATFWVYQRHIDGGHDINLARTAAVNAVVACEIVYLFNCRHLSRPLFARGGLSGNHWVPVAVVLVIVMQIGFTHLPFMQMLFQTVALPLESWGIILACSLPLLFVVEAEKALAASIRRWRHKRSHRLSSL